MKKLDSKFWKKYFIAYDVLNKAIPYSELLNTLVDSLAPTKNDLILDAGAGTCNLSILLKRKGAHVIALDSSPEGLAICKKKSMEIDTCLHDLEEALPFNDNHFDKIVSNNAIYLLDKSKRKNLFKEFYRVLKPNGILVVSNIHTGFRPMLIYKEHIIKHYKKHGFLKTVSQLTKLTVPTIKIFLYNAKIKRSHIGDDKTSFMTETTLMKNAGFRGISSNTLIYAEQAYLNKCYK